MIYLIRKICFICLAAALPLLAQAQGYDTTCSVNAMGHLQCNTRPDVMTESQNLMRELDRLEAERLRQDPCQGDPFCIQNRLEAERLRSPPPPVGQIESIPGADALNQQLFQLQQMQRQQMQRQQMQQQFGAPINGISQGRNLYFIQLGAYRTKQEAIGLQQHLGSLGIRTAISLGRTSASVYRVRMGPFKDEADARLTADRLEKAGYQNIIVRIRS